MTLEHRACPAFSQADLSNFGRSECDVGHCRRCARIVSRQQRIANSLKSLPPRKVRELLAAYHIPRGVNMSGSSLEKLVHRSEEHTSELQSLRHLVCRLLLEKK